ncbi:isoprenylcysteine carboxyl methyltransferase family protein [Streptomyces sp. P38-E01]|uniref:Isoprenylcysteine carboxyl methyltransferase family protein n=1 Tax=Streptomyces tardus TaxID=2780544 RepID=A0A949N3R6_9ACTN|nr:isoprenylcysteine carboxyl methyltransferase family protein [Streptomyces tardus]
MFWFTALVLLVGVERLVELVVSKRNTRWSLERGGVEHGFGHYPPMVVLHTGLLLGALLEVGLADREFSPALGWTMLLLVVASQGLRWWCIHTLGPRWNTRVIVVPGLPLVAGGPYRLMRHPNYVAVAVEGLALPLVHGAWITGAVFTLLNAALMVVRIRCEDDALRPAAPTSSDRSTAPGGAPAPDTPAPDVRTPRRARPTETAANSAGDSGRSADTAP